MADTSLQVGTFTGGGTVGADVDNGTLYFYNKVAYGGSGTITRAAVETPLPVANVRETENYSQGGTLLLQESGTLIAVAAGTAEVVAAAAGKKIRVTKLHYTGNAATTVIWRSGTAGTDLTGTIDYAQAGGPAMVDAGGVLPDALEGSALAVVVTGGTINGWLKWLEVD